MISKNKYKEKNKSSKEDKFFYQRIQELAWMSFIIFYTAFHNEKQQQCRKKQETYRSINLCIPGGQQPERIDYTKTEKKAKTE